jgi:hypothetical protein
MLEKVMVPIRFTAAVLLLIVGPGLIPPQPLRADDPPCEEALDMWCWWQDEEPPTPDAQCGSGFRGLCVTCADHPTANCERGERTMPNAMKINP